MAYVGFSQEEGEIFARAFSESQGGRVKVRVKKINTGKLAEMLEKEGAGCEASVVFGGSLPAYEVAAKKKLLQPYRSREAAGYDKKFIDPAGLWTGIYVGIIGFAWNTKSKLPPPESWADLLKPEYKGKIALSDPNYSGTAYIMLSTLAQMKGEAPAFVYLKALDGQAAAYTRSGAEPVEMVSRRIVDIGVSFAHDILKVTRKNPAVALLFPKEGTGLEIGGAAIPAHSPNPELAKKFIDFLASPAGQNLSGTEGVSPRFPTNPAAKRPDANLSRAGALKLIEFDFARSAADEIRLKKKWTELIQGGAAK